MRKQVQNYEARQAAAAYVRQALAGKTKEEAYQVLQSLSVDTLRRALSVFGLFARDCKSEMVNAIFATSSKVPVFHRRANSSASPPPPTPDALRGFFMRPIYTIPINIVGIKPGVGLETSYALLDNSGILRWVEGHVAR